MARFIPEDPGLSSYVTRVSKLPSYDRAEELDLARRYAAGERDAGDALVRAQLLSVVRIARHYTGYGIQLSELIGEGNVGLLEALKRFDPERGLRFITYARYWIRAHILAHVLKHWSIVDLGTTALQSRMFFRLKSEHARLAGQLGSSDDTIARRLAERFGTTEENIRDSLGRLSGRDRSLDVPLTEGGVPLVDALVDRHETQEQTAASAETSALVREAVSNAWPLLDARERTIVERRLLPRDEAESLAAIGHRFGVTRERVRQIEVGVKAKIRLAFEQLVGSDGGFAPQAAAPSPLVAAPSPLAAAPSPLAAAA